MIEHPSDEDDSETGQSTQDGELTYEISRTERPSMAAVRAVASLTDTPVLDLDPLYNVIDPAHFDELSGGSETDKALTGSSVTFSFNECRVTVTQDAVHVNRETS